MIYPVRCPICGEIVTPKGRRICITCKERIHYVNEPRCKKCSKPIEQEEKEFCSDCVKKNYHFSRGFSVWIYDKEIKHSIADFKYHSRKENARFYVEELVRIYGEDIIKLSPNVIIPIPIHSSKYYDRGYNQADILARGIGKALDISVLSHLLIRNKKTLPQKQLSDKERLCNLRQAFKFNKKEQESFHRKIDRVLLVDDIYTTGSTIEACTNVLMEQGIGEVYFITLCIGKGF